MAKRQYLDWGINPLGSASGLGRFTPGNKDSVYPLIEGRLGVKPV